MGGLITVSCSEDNTVFNDPSPIRAYETDVEILAQFVDVNNTTGVFFLSIPIRKSQHQTI